MVSSSLRSTYQVEVIEFVLQFANKYPFVFTTELTAIAKASWNEFIVDEVPLHGIVLAVRVSSKQSLVNTTP